MYARRGWLLVVGGVLALVNCLAGAEQKPGERTVLLLTDHGQACQVDANGKIDWCVEGLEFPLDLQLLPNDHILVAEYRANRISERDLKGTVVWQHKIDNPLVAQRLN